MLQHEKASTLSSYDVSTLQDLFLSPDKRPPKPQPELPPEAQSLESHSTLVPEIANEEAHTFDDLALNTSSQEASLTSGAESKAGSISNASHAPSYQKSDRVDGGNTYGESARNDSSAAYLSARNAGTSEIIDDDGRSRSCSGDDIFSGATANGNVNVQVLKSATLTPPVINGSAHELHSAAHHDSTYHERGTVAIPTEPSPVLVQAPPTLQQLSPQVVLSENIFSNGLHINRKDLWSEPAPENELASSAPLPLAQAPQASVVASADSLKHWSGNRTTDLATEYFGSLLLSRGSLESGYTNQSEGADDEVQNVHRPEGPGEREKERLGSVTWEAADMSSQPVSAQKNGSLEVNAAWRTVKAAEARAALMSRAEQELKTQGLRRALREASPLEQIGAPLNLSRSHEAAQLSSSYMDPIGEGPESPMSGEKVPRHQHRSDLGSSLELVRESHESPDALKLQRSTAPCESIEKEMVTDTGAHGLTNDNMYKAVATPPPQQQHRLSPPLPSSHERSRYSRARDRVREALHSSPGSSYGESQSSSSGSSRGYSTDRSNEARNLIRERLHSNNKSSWSTTRGGNGVNYSWSGSSSSSDVIATEDNRGNVHHGRMQPTQSPVFTLERPAYNNVRTPERATPWVSFSPERPSQSANRSPEKSSQSAVYTPERNAVVEHDFYDAVFDSDDGSVHTIDHDYSTDRGVISTQHRMLIPYGRRGAEGSPRPSRSSHLGAGFLPSKDDSAHHNAEVPMRSQFAARAAAAARAADCAQTSAAFARAAQAAAAEYRAAESAVPSPTRPTRASGGKLAFQKNTEKSSFSRASLEGVTTTPGGSLFSFLVPHATREQQQQPEFSQSWPWVDKDTNTKVDSSSNEAKEERPATSPRADTEPLPHQSAWTWPPNNGHEREGLRSDQNDLNSEKSASHCIDTPPRPSAQRKEASLSIPCEYDDSTLDVLFSKVCQNHDELVAIGLGIPLQNRDPSWG